MTTKKVIKAKKPEPLHTTLALDVLMRWTSVYRIENKKDMKEFLFRISYIMNLGVLYAKTEVVNFVAMYEFKGKKHELTTDILAKYIGYVCCGGKESFLPRKSFFESAFVSGFDATMTAGKYGIVLALPKSFAKKSGGEMVIKSPVNTPEYVEASEKTASMLLKKIPEAVFKASDREFVNREMSLQPYYHKKSPGLFRRGDKYGFRSPDGKVVVPAKFEDFMTLSSRGVKKGERVTAQDRGKWGVVIADGKGNWLIKPEYDYIGFPNDLTHVLKDGKWGILNISKGEYLVKPECDEIPAWNGFMFTNRVGFYKKGGKWGVVMDWGQMTEPLFDDYGGDTDDGWVELKYKGKWGYINEKNQFTADEEEAFYRYYLD